MATYVPRPVQTKVFAGRASKDIPAISKGSMVLVHETGRIEVMSEIDFKARYQLDQVEEVGDVEKAQRKKREFTRATDLPKTHMFRVVQTLITMYLGQPKEYMIPLELVQKQEPEINVSARLSEAVSRGYAERYKSGLSIRFRPTTEGIDWVRANAPQGSIPGIE